MIEEIYARLDQKFEACMAIADRHMENGAYDTAALRRHRAHGIAQAMEIVKEYM
jgi:hypothetical protein